MRRRAKIRIAGTLVATLTPLLLCGPATSQTTDGAGDQAVTEQVQLGDVFATQTLHVDSASSGASSASTAIANSATATGQNTGLDNESSQTVNGAVTAVGHTSVGGDSGPYYAASSSATGNSGDAGTCCGTVTGTTTQTVGPNVVSAQSYAYLGGYTDAASVDASALGNTQGFATTNGGIATTAVQLNNGSTQAISDVASVGSVGGSSSYTATGIANDIEVNATNSPVALTASQTQDGYITEANVDAVQNAGSDVTAMATATANNLNVTSDSYGDNVSSTQVNYNPVNATSALAVNDWSGTAASIGYGVGNSSIVSNSGSYTGMANDQTSNGAITVNASFTGGAGGGGDAYVSSTGVGNAVSGYACPSCNGTFEASSRQVNSGGVTTTASLTAGGVGAATSVSSAVGNTATFQVHSK